MKKGDNCVGYSCYMSKSEAVSTDFSSVTHRNVPCAPHHIAEKCLIWCWQSLNHSCVDRGTSGYGQWDIVYTSCFCLLCCISPIRLCPFPLIAACLVQMQPRPISVSPDQDSNHYKLVFIDHTLIFHDPNKEASLHSRDALLQDHRRSEINESHSVLAASPLGMKH
jgi:hypothetical protein